MSDHYLIVGPFDPDDDTDRFDVEHPADCPTIKMYDSPEGPVLVENCGVGYHVDAAGIDGWFQHADDPAPSGYRLERVPAGRHRIEARSDTVRYAYGVVEHDGGLRVAENQVTS